MSDATSRTPAELLDVSDLVADAYEHVERTAASTAAATPATSAITSSATSAAARNDASLPHNFCVKLGDLLRILSQTFEERSNLVMWYHMFQTTVLGNRDRELEAIKRWHHEMMYDKTDAPREVDLYDLTEQRRIDELLSSDFEVFTVIEAHALYFDPDLTAEDREMLCKHFDNINAHARMFACLPMDMISLIEEKVSQIDPATEINADTIQSLAQSILGCGPGELGAGPEAADRLQSWAVDMCQKFSEPGAMRGLQTLMESAMQQAGDLNLGGLLSQFQEEISRGAEVVDSRVDSVELHENDALRSLMSGLSSSVFSSLGGGGGGSAGAGAGSGSSA